MKMKINEEYQKLIDEIDEILEKADLKLSHKGTLKRVQYFLKNIGTRPIISDNVEKFMNITNDMAKTYAAKNHDYGNSFEESLDKFGLIASVVRIGDKMNRIESLMKKEAQVKDESIRDTLLDLASYSVMTLMWLNKQQK